MADITPQQLLIKLQEASQSVRGANFLRTVMLLLERGVECDGSGKAYILGRVGFEYNDEIYYTGESGGCYPEGVYLSKKIAQDAHLKEEILAFRSTNITQYYYDVHDIFGDPDEIQRIWQEDAKITKPEWGDKNLFEDFHGWKDMPLAYTGEEVLLKIIAEAGLGFYDLTEVPLVL